MVNRVVTRLQVAILALVLPAFAGLLRATEPTEPTEPRALTFGVVPQQAAAQLARGWTPVLDAVGRGCDCRLEFETAPDIPTFEQRLAAGEYDLAYMNPYHYTVFHESAGYGAFAKQAGKRIQGIIVVTADSPYTKVEDLAGLEVAFPAPAAFAATVLPLASFRRMGFEVEPVYVASHDSVYMSVARGLFPAGGGIVRTFSTIDPEIRDRLRVLWRTAEYTPHAFAARSTVPAELVSAIQQGFVELAETAEGVEALARLGMSGIEAATDSDWDDVRALDIRLLESKPTPRE